MTSKSMQVIDWMVDEANSTELRLVSILANALYLQAKPPEPFDPVALNKAAAGFSKEYDKVQKRKAKEKKVKTVVSPVTKRKYKTKAKGFDPAKVLAAARGPETGRTGNKDKGPRVGSSWERIYAALKETTGKIGAPELAEYLNLDAHKVSTILSGRFKSSEKGLLREATKTTWPDGRVVASYLYWLDGGLK